MDEVHFGKMKKIWLQTESSGKLQVTSQGFFSGSLCAVSLFSLITSNSTVVSSGQVQVNARFRSKWKKETSKWGLSAISMNVKILNLLSISVWVQSVAGFNSLSKNKQILLQIHFNWLTSQHRKESMLSLTSTGCH